MKILGRVFERHPDILAEDVETAWESRIKTQFRIDGDRPYLVAVGVSRSGKVLEMIAFEDCGEAVVFHAMTPPTKKLLAELDML